MEGRRTPSPSKFNLAYYLKSSLPQLFRLRGGGGTRPPSWSCAGDEPPHQLHVFGSFSHLLASSRTFSHLLAPSRIFSSSCVGHPRPRVSRVHPPPPASSPSRVPPPLYEFPPNPSTTVTIQPPRPPMRMRAGPNWKLTSLAHFTTQFCGAKLLPSPGSPGPLNLKLSAGSCLPHPEGLESRLRVTA